MPLLHSLHRAKPLGLVVVFFLCLGGVYSAVGETIDSGLRLGYHFRLPYTSTNADAGEPSRYGLLLPAAFQSRWEDGSSLVLLFDAELDVDAFRRRLRFCYRNDGADRLPAHNRCVSEIPATIHVTTGPGVDAIVISPVRATQGQSFNLNRSSGVWVDLINPTHPGVFAVELLEQLPQDRGSVRAPLGRWLIRIEQPNVDSPASED